MRRPANLYLQTTMNRLRSILLAVATVVCTTMMAQTPNTITQQVYWLDGDISSAQTVTSTVDISGLLPGLHSYSIRVKDSNGLWSSIVTKYFVIPYNEPTATAIAQREYWIDGNVAARTTLGESPAVISIGSLSSGLHSLTVRVKDDASLWSSVVTKYFIIPSATESSSVAIARYMYWIDGDVANYVEGNVTGSAIVINFSALSEGTHTLSWRVSDTKGAWGMVKTETFTYSNLTAAGDWNVAANWNTGVVPAAGTDVTIAANITIPSDYIANAGDITIADGGSLTIEDGGQLITTSTDVVAKVQKATTASTAKASNAWYAIASPINNGIIENFAQGTHNVYRYVEKSNYWNEYRNTTVDEELGLAPFTTFENGRGYLYRSTVANVAYTGTINASNVEYALSYACANDNFKGFNLIGNPFTHDVYKGVAISNDYLEAKYYILNIDGTWTLKEDSEAIPSGTAILVQAKETADGKNVVMTNTSASAKSEAGNDNIWFTIKNNEFSDVACVEFKDGRGLNKMAHYNENAPMLYIKHDGERFASVDMPVDTKNINLCFKAKNLGYNTLSFKVNGEFSYLHLIDRLTGNDVDMLLDGEYTFIASPKDNENRFLVVLDPQEALETLDGSFAFQNGNDIIVNGNGELQIFDVMGRLIATQRVNGVETVNVSMTGVYIFKLNEKTQKIVIQ